ncbi:N-acetylmuramoyl-L-alanine amidase [Psychromarinibacter sp. C21-152]|uniref:N-acetylmuramoyl-L-alanine amidase n=1 Tax=Psychromarinibacter sediminicola TaxID=3033385 RepID=A0AAE3NQ58_9RHOB|nr:N-acetylmuramoyl-L-alanine amidase [Psychromarinibacter sediminicola]MDF0600056.1 N-acetylmuramoyl-L-alanine amidase [Psychromarinibacter sediminicola]
MSRLLLTMMALVWATVAVAQDLTGLARLDSARSALRDDGRGLELVLGLSQPVPYRVFTLDDPRRLVLDFSVVDWSGLDADAIDTTEAARVVSAGVFRPGWSRMVVELARPMAVGEAWMDTGDAARVTVKLVPVAPEVFAAAAGAPSSALFALPEPSGDLPPPHRRQDGSRPVVVVLDPGHGGIDPGAERDGVVEADLMLRFARELREVLQRAGGFDVVLTRDDDIFVPLEMRVSIARMAGADVFLSLHADALAEGRARGATIYTLSEEASDVASEKLAERHDRGDLLAGVDLTEQDDRVAHVLMEMARLETRPRADRLADALVAALEDSIGPLHKRPRLEASFSVLKAADIPSVLVELGFLSSKRDRENLLDPDWRAQAADGIRDALIAWAKADAAEASLLRQ